MGSSSAQSALQRERDEVEAGRQKIEQLQAQLAAERRDKSELQVRCDAAMNATVSRQEKAELLQLRAIFGVMQKRLQRVEIANQQLEKLVEEHDIPIPLNIHMFQPSVSQPHARTQHREAGWERGQKETWRTWLTSACCHQTVACD